MNYYWLYINNSYQLVRIIQLIRSTEQAQSALEGNTLNQEKKHFAWKVIYKLLLCLEPL